MSDAECDACARYDEAVRELREREARDPLRTFVILSELGHHHAYEDRLRAENANLRFEGKILTEAAVNAILALRGGTRAQAMKYLRDSSSPLADHPDAGGKEESA